MATPKIQDICEFRFVTKYYTTTVNDQSVTVNAAPVIQFRNVGEEDWLDIPNVTMQVPPPKAS